MKKVFNILLAAVLLISITTGCSDSAHDKVADDEIDLISFLEEPDAKGTAEKALMEEQIFFL